MTTSLRNAIDEAKFVKFHDEFDTSFAVWHGGFTVNYYSVVHRNDTMLVEPTTTQTVGDMSKDAATLAEVKEAIEETFSEDRR